jgi:hypothetical protein
MRFEQGRKPVIVRLAVVVGHCNPVATRCRVLDGHMSGDRYVSRTRRKISQSEFEDSVELVGYWPSFLALTVVNDRDTDSSLL